MSWGAFDNCSSLEYIYATNVDYGQLIGNGKRVSDSLVAVLPKVNIAEQKTANWKIALCKGFVLNPEMFINDLWDDNLAVVIKQRKKLLAWAFSKDYYQVVKFFIEHTTTTKAKFKSEYLSPAQEAKAEKCVAYLLSKNPN